MSWGTFAFWACLIGIWVCGIAMGVVMTKLKVANKKYGTVNDLAEAVAKREGKKIQVNIAQIKEVLRCTNEELGTVGIDLYGIIKGK